jgi:hypothetical protein
MVTQPVTINRHKIVAKQEKKLTILRIIHNCVEHESLLSPS